LLVDRFETHYFQVDVESALEQEFKSGASHSDAVVLPAAAAHSDFEAELEAAFS
jgi:hypothetical protein